MVAFREPVHVEPRAGARFRCKSAGSLGHVDVLRSGDLDVGGAALDESHLDTSAFGNGGIVGQIRCAVAGSLPVGGQNRGKLKALGCLRAPEIFTTDGGCNHVRGIAALERIGDGQCQDRAFGRLERCAERRSTSSADTNGRAAS